MGCTFPVISKKLFLMTLHCKSEWLGLCEFKRRTLRGALPAIGQATLQGIIRNGKKWNSAPSSEGASSKQASPTGGQAKTLSAQSAKATSRVGRVPYLNPDAFSRFIGPRNWGQALINDELTTCLLDNGAQLNFITPSYAIERGMDIMSLDWLAQR